MRPLQSTTDELEQGTYVYFDYETGWCQVRRRNPAPRTHALPTQRIKKDFTFYYRHLEDELQINP
jgi:CCR4-NOT transcription complex subunit 3